MPEVAFDTTCEVCHRQWQPDDDDRWQAHHVGDDRDEPPELIFYCPRCAASEFDGA